MKALYWSPKRPTEPGWYWCRNTGNRTGPYAAKVAEFVCRVDRTQSGQHLFCTWLAEPGKAGILLDNDWSENCLWAGPIPAPEDCAW